MTMPTYTVFHSVLFNAGLRPHVLVHDFPSGYVKVADVECTHPEEAYRLTNHVDGPWQRNTGVKAFCDSARSTSASDIIVTPGGDKLYVAWLGMWPLHRRRWWPFTLEGSSDNQRVSARALLADWVAHCLRAWRTAQGATG